MKMLRIVSKQAGFRRCGVAHPAEATDHPMDRFSKDEIERLSADPMLYVHEVEAEDPDKGPEKKSGNGKGGKAEKDS